VFSLHLFLCFCASRFLSFAFSLLDICTFSMGIQFQKRTVTIMSFVCSPVCVPAHRSPRSRARGGPSFPRCLRTLSGRPGVCSPKRYDNPAAQCVRVKKQTKKLLERKEIIGFNVLSRMSFIPFSPYNLLNVKCKRVQRQLFLWLLEATEDELFRNE